MNRVPEPRVGYILKKYPRLSETFIVEELLSIERRGLGVQIFSLGSPGGGRFHPQIAQVQGAVEYLPAEKPSKLWFWASERRDWLERHAAGIGRAALQTMQSPASSSWESLAMAIRIAEQGERLGIRHYHAHFATIATEVASLVHRITGRSFSFTAHAKDIYRKTVDPQRFAGLARSASRVITVCEANRDFILEHLAPGQDDKVQVVYNGVDLERFAPLNGDVPEPLTIVGIGRLVEKKGFSDLVEACGRLKQRGIEFRCRIVGDGEEAEPLRARIRGLSLEGHVTLEDALTQDEIAELLPRAALLCQPCRIGEDGNRDALPTVLLEALASGVPCISTPVGGIPEIIEDGVEGRLVPPGDSAALAEALAQGLTDEAWRQRARRAARQKAEARFDTDRRGDRLTGELRRFVLAADGVAAERTPPPLVGGRKE